MAGNGQAVLEAAQKLFDQSPSFASFYRQIFSIDGTIRQEFSAEELVLFQRTDEDAKIEDMLSKLRVISLKEDSKEKDDVITVRIPPVMHQSLKDEAHDLRMSMNALCVVKLARLYSLIEK